MQRLLPISLLLLATSGCLFAPNATPRVEFETQVLSQYLFRGVPQTENGALQGRMQVAMPTRNDANVMFDLFGNMDLSNNNNDGALGDENGGEFSRIDFMVAYAQRLSEALNLAAGVVSYNFPGNQINTFIGNRMTTALFASLVFGAINGFVPTATVFADIDEGDGVYVQGAIQREFELGDRVRAQVGATLGATDNNYSEVWYGVSESGLADLAFLVALLYDFDENTVLHAKVGGSTILENDIADPLDNNGIDSDNLWFGVGATWSY